MKHSWKYGLHFEGVPDNVSLIPRLFPLKNAEILMSVEVSTYIYLKWVEVASKIVHAVDYVGKHFYWYKNFTIFPPKCWDSYISRSVYLHSRLHAQSYLQLQLISNICELFYQ